MILLNKQIINLRFWLKINVFMLNRISLISQNFHKFIIMGSMVILWKYRKLQKIDRKFLIEESLKYPAPVRVCPWCNGMIWRKAPCHCCNSEGH